MQKETVVVDRQLQYLIMHQVLQALEIYGGQVMTLIYMYIMVMVILINGSLLHQMLP